MQISKPVPTCSTTPSCSFRFCFKYEQLPLHTWNSWATFAQTPFIHWNVPTWNINTKSRNPFGGWNWPITAHLCSGEAASWRDILNEPGGGGGFLLKHVLKAHYCASVFSGGVMTVTFSKHWGNIGEIDLKVFEDVLQKKEKGRVEWKTWRRAWTPVKTHFESWKSIFISTYTDVLRDTTGWYQSLLVIF